MRPFQIEIVEKRDFSTVSSLVICNYDRLAGKGSKALIAKLMKQQWDAIICAEAHVLKNSRAQRSKAVLGYWDKRARAKVPGIIDSCRRRLFLTGTPMLNKPMSVRPISPAPMMATVSP